MPASAVDALVTPALIERLVLLVNHVVGREPAATSRLAPHAGRRLRIEPVALPWPLRTAQPLVFAITPAGRFEWRGDGAAADGEAVDLTVSVEASNPARLAWRALAGEPPALAIEGDARLAADIDWIATNLRWDVADDLERVVGPAAAQRLARLGGALGGTLRRGARGLASLAERVGAGMPPGPR